MRAALGFGHLPKTEGFARSMGCCHIWLSKLFIVLVSRQPKQSSTAAWSCTHRGHLILERKLPYPISVVNLWGADMSNAELGQHHRHVPLGAAHPAHLSASTLGFSLCPGLFSIYPVCSPQSSAYSQSLNTLRRWQFWCSPKPPELLVPTAPLCPLYFLPQFTQLL